MVLVFMVCRIYSENGLVGFRLIDDISYKIKNVSYDSVYNAILSGGSIENLCIKDGKIVGKGGSLSRYTAVDTSNTLLVKPSTVILSKSNADPDDGYYIANYKGEIDYVNKEKLIIQSRNNCIANAKVVNRNGSYIISSIEGSIKEAAEQTNPKNNSKYTKFYKMPALYKGSGNQILFNNLIEKCRSEVLTKKISKKAGINDSYVKRIPGVCLTRKGSFQTYSCFGHRIYCNKQISEIFLSISELNIPGLNKFLVVFDNLSLMVNDIIHIGKNWVSSLTCNNNITSSLEAEFDDDFVFLGNTGVIYSRYLADISKYETVEVLYSEINSAKDISDRINTLGINGQFTSIFTPEIMEVIRVYKDNTPYKTKLLGFDDIKLFASDNISVDEESTGIESLYAIDCLDTNSRGSCAFKLEITIDDFLANTINIELSFALNPGEFMWTNTSNHILSCNNTFGYRRGRFIHYKDGKPMYMDTGLDVKYLIYYSIYKMDNNFFDENISEWIPSKYRERIDSGLIHAQYSSNKNKVELLLFSHIATIDVLNIRKLYKEDKEKRIGIQKRIKGLNDKSKLFGQEIYVNEIGYLEDWSDNTRLDLNYGIKGVSINRDNYMKSLTIVTKGIVDFDIISSSRFFRGGSGTITFVLEASNLGLIYKIDDKLYYSDNYKIEVNSKDLTPSDYDMILGYLVCKLMLSGCFAFKKGRSATSRNVLNKPASFYIRYANEIFVSDFDEKPLKLSDKVEIMVNSDGKIDEEKRAKFLKALITIISKLDKRSPKASNKRIGLFYLIVKYLFGENKAEDLTNRLRAFIKEAKLSK